MNIVQPIRDKSKIEEVKTELMKRGMRDYLLFVVGINTGLRVSDILKLRVSDVRGQDFYTLIEQKTGKRKRINLHAVKADIDAFTRNMEPDAFLFASRKGGDAITRVQAYRILNEAAAACGLDEIGTHTLRKTYGYHMYKRFHDVALLQKLFNHSSPSITLRYIGIEQDEIDEVTAEFEL